MTNVLILGAGFGGLEVATRLASVGGMDVTLIDRSDWFAFGFSKFDVMFGRKTADEIRYRYRDIAKPGVTFKQETITSIDPETKRVTTDAGAYDADILVVALGADYAPEATPGLVEHGYEYYSFEGAERAAGVLRDFGGGRIVVGVLGMPFKCPPAPYETVLLLHDYFTQARVRTTISLVTPMTSPIPVSKDVSAALIAALDERGIASTHSELVVEVGASSSKLRGGGTIGHDLFLAVPVHVAPDVVRNLCEDDGWIGVDKNSLRTKWDGVFALGDVASAPVPRAGVFAEDAAATVAAEIAGSPLPYRGKGNCYVEFGGGLVGKVDANFLEGPQPVAELVGPSVDIAREKVDFAAERKKRWFSA